MTSGWVIETHDYGVDMGSLHVIDWYLWLGALTLPRTASPTYHNPTRYLDGEEDREGIYR